jgi:hypothetical protein
MMTSAKENLNYRSASVHVVAVADMTSMSLSGIGSRRDMTSFLFQFDCRRELCHHDATFVAR